MKTYQFTNGTSSLGETHELEQYSHDAPRNSTDISLHSEAPDRRNMLPNEETESINSWTSSVVESEPTSLLESSTEFGQPYWGNEDEHIQTPRLQSPTGLAQRYKERRSRRDVTKSESLIGDSEPCRHLEWRERRDAESEFGALNVTLEASKYNQPHAVDTANKSVSSQQHKRDSTPSITKPLKTYDRPQDVSNTIQYEIPAGYPLQSELQQSRIYIWTRELEGRVQKRWNDSRLLKRARRSRFHDGLEEWRDYEAPVWLLVAGPGFIVLLLFVFICSILGTLKGTHT